MPYRAVLFDLDGTLLDTLADIANSANRALAAGGMPTHPIDAYRHYVGDGVTNLITRILPPDRRDPATVARFSAAYRLDYGINWNVITRPYEGVSEMLDAMAGRGLKLAIFSNKPHEFTVNCVGAQLARWRFDVVQGATDNLPRKPDPTGALRIAEQLNTPPAQFLYVGDTGTDMRTANNAGMFAVGVLWGFRDRAELESAGANRVIARPGELLEMI